jgi:phage antirepressor YoqD-like protein
MRALAKILGRSPTQLYKWLDPEEIVILQEASERRIATVEKMARLWDRQANSSMGELRRCVLSSGKTIVDILAADDIDEAEAENALSEIAKQLEMRPLSLAQRLKQKGFARRRRDLPDDDD